MHSGFQPLNTKTKPLVKLNHYNSGLKGFGANYFTAASIVSALKH